ncbi:MAG: 2'-5' RNA ligase family protein [Thermoguttaceae bacterium]|nr:2'-5' RNA ligase family protein [Thermoguttaceae bacterium]MDW8078140.1 2'-5' RNA ligase family protein [Thermoguttaceae bacterium]
MKTCPFVYTSAIVIIPPEDVWPPIQAIRLRYDEKVRRWMPHITMIYPFWPCEEFARAVDLLRPACQGVPPFELTLARFDTFDHGRGKYTMWLDPQPAEPLKVLHYLCVQQLGIPWGRGPFRMHFRPHLSVGQVRGQAERDRVLTELAERWQPLTFPVREIALIWRREPPDDVFRVGERISLGGR